MKQNAWVSVLKFLPLLVFASLVIFFKFDLLIAAPIATFVACIIFMITQKQNFETALTHGLNASRNIILVFFILMFAYGVAECFMATGVGAALINLSLQIGVTARTIAPLTIMVTALLSVATGSSWGTFAACAPIFLWLNHMVGGDILITVCSVAGGSCFGDNIGMISDVTVLSCGMQDVKIIDRVKHQGVWSLLCLVVSMLVFYFASMNLPNVQGNVMEAIAKIPDSAYTALEAERPSAILLLDQIKNGVPYYMIIPLIVVIGMSFMGIHTLLCLGSGMISSLICGYFAGTTDLNNFLNDLLFRSFGDAGSWTIVMMLWVSCFGGIMNAMNAFDPLARGVVKVSGNIHHLFGWCGLLCLFGNAALADEAAQVATMSPIVRSIVEKNTECETEEDAYKLRLKLATFTSSMGIYGSELIPWHCFAVFFAAIANDVYPLYNFTTFSIISKNYMSFIVIGSILLLTFTGWDRFIPNFGIPKGADLCKVKNI